MNAADAKTSAHEPDDASVRTVLVFAGILVAMLLIVAAMTAVQLRALRDSQPDRTAANSPDVSNVPPRVNDWARPGIELAQLQATQRQHLNEYAWIDHSAGVVRIPVSRAMQLLASDSTTQPTEVSR